MNDTPIEFFKVERKFNDTLEDTFIVAYGFWIPLPLMISPQGKGWVGDFATFDEAEINSATVKMRHYRGEGSLDVVTSLLIRDLLTFEDGGRTIAEISQAILEGLFDDTFTEKQTEPDSP